jgi:hypothetical protein
MLDLLEVPLRKAGYGFRRLDGTMTVAARERAIADFESSCDVMALIVVSAANPCVAAVLACGGIHHSLPFLCLTLSRAGLSMSWRSLL